MADVYNPSTWHSSIKPDEQPKEPTGGEVVWYRGWEAGFDDMASQYGAEPWRAYRGGVDLDAPQMSGRTWEALLDEIDAEEGN